MAFSTRLTNRLLRRQAICHHDDRSLPPAAGIFDRLTLREQAVNFGKLMPLVFRAGLVDFSSLKLVAKQSESFVRYGLTTDRQFEAGAAIDPHRVAFIDDLGPRTYEQARDDIRALARGLIREGFGNGVRIGVMARNSRAIVYPMSAKGLLEGNIYLFNPASSPRQLQSMLVEHDIDVLVIDEEFASYVVGAEHNCLVILGYPEPHSADDTSGPAASAVTDESHSSQSEPIEPGEATERQISEAVKQWPTLQQFIDEAPSSQEVKLPVGLRRGNIVIMSSGTSGTPKGVRIPEPKTPAIAGGLLQRVPWAEGQTIQLSASIFHFYGWGTFNAAMGLRCTVIMHRVFDPDQAVDDLYHYRPDGIVSAAIFLKGQIARMHEKESAGELNPADRPTLDFIMSSGNLIHSTIVEQIIDAFGPVLYNLYGSTECGPVALGGGELLKKHPTAAGPGVLGAKFRILDDEGHDVPQGTVGHIYAATPISLMGYTHARDVIEYEHGLIRIGDRGYLDAEGILYVTGRSDDMIINGGENVYPKSVEDDLAKMPGVDDLYVCGVADDERFARLRAYIVRTADEAGQELTEDKVRQWVRERIAEHSVPRDVIWIDELPRNDSGKVVPRLLPQP